MAEPQAERAAQWLRVQLRLMRGDAVAALQLLDELAASGAAQARPGLLRVVLVDDHRLFRAGVRSEIGERVDVVGEAELDVRRVDRHGRDLTGLVTEHARLVRGLREALQTAANRAALPATVTATAAWSLL